jgi:hypothetical protein
VDQKAQPVKTLYASTNDHGEQYMAKAGVTDLSAFDHCTGTPLRVDMWGDSANPSRYQRPRLFVLDDCTPARLVR